MRLLRSILLALFIIAAALLTYLGLAPPALLKVGAAYSAKIVCSNVFLAQRDGQEVLATDVQAPGIALLKLMRVSVDEPHGVVRAGLLGFIGDGVAVYRPGLGCTVLPDGKVSGMVRSGSALIGSARAAAGTVSAPDSAAAWPEGGGVTPSPAYQRLLDDAALVGPGMRGVIIVKDGRIVAERYAAGFNADTPLLGWSMAKTVTAGLAGLLIADGKLKLDQQGFWPAGDGRETIKLADLLAMSSGLKFDEDYGVVSDVTRMLYLEPDTAGFARKQPLAHPVGTFWSYSSGTANIVARIVQDLGGANFPQERLFKPLGMKSAVLEPDEHGTFVGSSYMYASARDWARYGLFLEQDGVWHGQRLLSEGFVDGMAAPVAASRGEYGHGFVWLWGSDPVSPGVNPDTAFGIPADTFYLSGHDGQTVAVIRSHHLIIVRLGLTPYFDHYTPQRLIQAVVHVEG